MSRKYTDPRACIAQREAELEAELEAALRQRVQQGVAPGTPVVVWCRESNDHGNLASQVRNMRREAAKAGAVVVAPPQAHVGTGKDLTRLRAAANLARQLGATLFAESTDRLIRPAGYTNTNQQARLTLAEIESLDSLGVPLAVVLDPVAPPRSYQTKRRGKAGYKKAKREGQLPRVLDLRAHGWPLAKIAKLVEVPRRTVSRWLKMAR